MTGSSVRWRQKLERGGQRLDARFLAGAGIEHLLRARARLVEEILCHAWREQSELAATGLFAAGGFGRGGLFPFSDVDIVLLYPGDKVPQQAVERFLSHIWDAGINPSHSVRSIAECVTEATRDLSTMTAMLEARQLCGDAVWSMRLRDALARDKIWSLPEFFRARMREQEARRDKFSRVTHDLEPCIKETRGGLRDLHMLFWISLRCFAEGGLAGLHRNGLINTREKRELQEAQQLLSRMRYALHLIAGRAEERLLFAHQRLVAAAIIGDDSQAAVARMMKSLCRATAVVDLYGEILLCDFAQRLLPGKRSRPRAINERFMVTNSRLDLRSRRILQKRPATLIEAFVLLTRRKHLHGFTVTTMRLIRDYAASNGAALREDVMVHEQFVKLLQAERVGEHLRLLHRYGVLDALLPPFAQIRGLTQFDLFHVHSVDIHTLQVLHHLDNFFARREDEYPEYYGLAKNIPRTEILYLAGLFHDIGKGRGGNHSVIGAKEAEKYCRQLQLDDYAVQMVSWLVRNHLLMSRTSQREDIDDSAVCERFAVMVEDVQHLDYLYLLTAADIRGTNPDLWNQWKHHLLSTLYRRALSRLRRSQDNLPEQRLRERRQKTLALLSVADAKAAPELWRDWHEDTFRRYQPEEIALQTRHILRNPGERVMLLLQPRTSRACTEVFLYMPTRDDLFAVVTRVLDHLNMNVVDARIISQLPGACTLDSYAMLERDGQCVRSRTRSEEIRTTLHKALRAPRTDKLEMLPPMRMLPQRLRHFRVPTEVSFTTDEQRRQIIMEVTALDQPGLLCRIATILYNAGVSLRAARIMTFGERAEDIFYLHQDVSAASLESIRQEIIVTVGADRQAAFVQTAEQ